MDNLDNIRQSQSQKQKYDSAFLFSKQQLILGKNENISAEDTQENEGFSFSSLYDLKAHSYWPKVIVFLLCSCYILGVTALYLQFNLPLIFIALLLIVNFLVLILFGNYMLRAVLFPYGNYLIKKKIDSEINARYSRDFAKLIQQLHRTLRIFAGQVPMEAFYLKTPIETSKKGQDDAEERSLLVRAMSESKNETDSRDRKKIIVDINSKMFTIVELMSIYTAVNQKLLDNKKFKKNSPFAKSTLYMSEIIDKLKQLNITFHDKEIDLDRFRNVYSYYSKELIDEDQQEAALQQKLPNIHSTQMNKQILQEIGELSEKFSATINRALRNRCGCFCRFQRMYGFMEQNMLLLEKNFDAQHFMIKGHRRSAIDCMFFPCTTQNNFTIDLNNPQGDFLSKPTYIVCNPNALIYQNMVNQPNAYWLTFFLKRGINVMCWNYRDYGLSKSSCCIGINPYNTKLDAEKVVEFLVNKLQVKGPLGVYGRSIGGIASTHLANKFPQYVKSLIVDRTFNELDILSERRMTGRCTTAVFRLISYNWKALNDRNFTQAKCFKILTCDPNDDVVDNFSSLAVGVAQKLSTKDYNQLKWKRFYQCLCALFDLEELLNKKLSEEDREKLTSRVLINGHESIDTDFSRNFSLNKDDDDMETVTPDIESNMRISLLKKESKNTNNLVGSTVSLLNKNDKLENKISVDYLKKRISQLKHFKEIQFVIHTIVLLLNDLVAGTLSMRDLLNMTRLRKFDEFQTFLKVLEVYGVGYEDDISQDKQNLDRSTFTHTNQTILELSAISDCCQQQLMLIHKKDSKHYGENNVLKGHLANFLSFQIECFEDLINIQRDKRDKWILQQRQLGNTSTNIQYYDDFTNIEQGHLVYMKCGHRGKPSRLEEKRISRLLRKSGFIPMLEELYNAQKPKPIQKPQVQPNQKDIEVEELDPSVWDNFQYPPKIKNDKQDIKDIPIIASTPLNLQYESSNKKLFIPITRDKSATLAIPITQNDFKFNQKQLSDSKRLNNKVFSQNLFMRDNLFTGEGFNVGMNLNLLNGLKPSDNIENQTNKYQMNKPKVDDNNSDDIVDDDDVESHMHFSDEDSGNQDKMEQDLDKTQNNATDDASNIGNYQHRDLRITSSDDGNILKNFPLQ
eukprot:403333935